MLPTVSEALQIIARLVIKVYRKDGQDRHRFNGYTKGIKTKESTRTSLHDNWFTFLSDSCVDLLGGSVT